VQYVAAMQITAKPSQGMAVALLTVIAAAHTAWARLAPASQLVDFSKHGGDWKQDQCGSRFRQSPIDLNEIYRTPSGDFLYLYPEVNQKDVLLKNDGRVILADLAKLGALAGDLYLPLLSGTARFSLSSIVLRSKSEHTLRGRHSPLEIQLVHTPNDTAIDPVEGPAFVTVSLLVTCVDPPEVKPVYPGAAMLQKETHVANRSQDGVNASRAMSSRSKPASAFLQRTDPVMDGDAQSNVSVEADAEVDFVHSLLEGEQVADKTYSAVPAPAPAPAGDAEDEVYRRPSKEDINFNPFLQFLVTKEPPSLDTETIVSLSAAVPLNLGKLLHGGTYFRYWGSETLPPCSERNIWLVRREELMASKAQVVALHKSLHLMSAGVGNYRTIMPMGGREVDVLLAKEGEPPRPTPAPPNTEAESTKIAKEAITEAKAASDYAKEVLDLPLQRASAAHAMEMKVPLKKRPQNFTTIKVPNPPKDVDWALEHVKNVVRQAMEDEFMKEIQHLKPATENLAKSILRQRILHSAGYRFPTTTPEPSPEEKQLEEAIAIYDPFKNMTYYMNGTQHPGPPPPGIQVTTATIGAAPSAAPQNTGPSLPSTKEEPAQNQPITSVPLPPGEEYPPQNWPDPIGWPNGLPPENWPSGADPAVWPDPLGPQPANMDAYTWNQYQYNWQHHPTYAANAPAYKAANYEFHRRRTTTVVTTSSGRRRTTIVSSGGRRRSATIVSGGRRRSSVTTKSSGRRRSSTVTSSGRRRGSGRRRSSTVTSSSSGRRRRGGEFLQGALQL